MVFSKALELLLNTVGNKIRRVNWPDEQYLTREIDAVNGKTLVIMNFRINDRYPHCKEPFRALSEDLTASDWIQCT